MTARTDDRLSTSLDKWLFFVIFVIGSSVMSIEKTLNAPRWVAPVSGALAIAAFCGISWKTPRFRLREDRIGDGAYYLGFLFTLVSLAFALYQFTEQGGTEGVISGFGVALVTTIVGVALRVAFQQLREDPIEIEQAVRRTLSEEVLALEREVRLSVESMALLRTRTDEELRNAVGAGLKEILKDTREAVLAQAEALRSTVVTTLESVAGAVEASQTQAAETRQLSARLIKAVNRLSERIEGATLPTDSLQQQLDGVAAAWKALLDEEATRIAKSQQAAESVLNACKHMESLATGAAVSMGRCKQAVDEMQSTVESSAASAREITASAKQITEDLMERSRRSIEVFERVEKMCVDGEVSLRSLRESLEGHVQVSSEALLALERNVVQASELIVRELNAK